MLNSWIASLTEANVISILLLLVVLFSLLQGWSRGFSRAAGGLFGLLGTGLLTAAALLIAVPAALYMSPLAQSWAASVVLPDSRLSGWQQLYYTAVSVLEGSPLVRFFLLLLIAYTLIRPLLGCCSCFCPSVSQGGRNGRVNGGSARSAGSAVLLSVLPWGWSADWYWSSPFI